MAGLNIYLSLFLVLAVFLFGGLAASAIMKVFRLRNKRMSWRAGTLKGFPLFSTVFMVLSLILAVSVWFNGETVDIAASFCYLFIAGSWFLSSYFTSKRYIIEHGIVKNVNDPAQTVAWHQIHDFFEKPVNNGIRFTFIYFEESRLICRQAIRLEITVPQKKVSSFKKLISHKLGNRLHCYKDEGLPAKTLNKLQ